MITVHGFPRARSVRVGWTREALGLDADHRPVELRSGERLERSLDGLLAGPTLARAREHEAAPAPGA